MEVDVTSRKRLFRSGNVGKLGRTAPLPLAVAIAPIGRRKVLGQLAAAGQLEQGLQGRALRASVMSRGGSATIKASR